MLDLSRLPRRSDPNLENRRRAHAEANALFKGGPAAPATTARRSTLGTYGLGTAAEAPSLSRKSDPFAGLRVDVAVAAQRHSLPRDAALVLDYVAQRSDRANGAAVDLSTDDVMSVAGVSRERASNIIGALEARSLLLRRANGIGPTGYVAGLSA